MALSLILSTVFQMGSNPVATICYFLKQSETFKKISNIRKRPIVAHFETKKPNVIMFGCEPGGTRTPNLLIRSQVHYPIMLQVHVFSDPQSSRCT
jgi:hypothetical protein